MDQDIIVQSNDEVLRWDRGNVTRTGCLTYLTFDIYAPRQIYFPEKPL